MISVKKVSFTNSQTQVSLVFDSPLWVPRSKPNTPGQCHCISVVLVLEATPEAKSRVRGEGVSRRNEGHRFFLSFFCKKDTVQTYFK